MHLSIIIPAYNCADTLENAVASAAFCENSEIIIVDDGSTDTTAAKIKEIECKFKNVRSVKQSNSGPANARNTGISIAKGEYIMFIDSDDTFTPGAITKVIAEIENDTDMLIFGFRQDFMGRAEDKIYTLDAPFRIDTFYKNNLLNQVWNKAYKRDFIIRNNIRFEHYKYGEDRIFNADVLAANPKVKAISDVLYNYNIDKSVSLISGYIPEKFEACKKINNRFSALCEDKSVSDFMFLKNIVSCMTVLFADNCKLSKKEKKQEIEKIISDNTVKLAMKAKQNGANEIIRRIIKTESITLNYIFAFLVAFVQKHMLLLFLKFRK